MPKIEEIEEQIRNDSNTEQYVFPLVLSHVMILFKQTSDNWKEYNLHEFFLESVETICYHVCRLYTGMFPKTNVMEMFSKIPSIIIQFIDKPLFDMIGLKLGNILSVYDHFHQNPTREQFDKTILKLIEKFTSEEKISKMNEFLRETSMGELCLLVYSHYHIDSEKYIEEMKVGDIIEDFYDGKIYIEQDGKRITYQEVKDKSPMEIFEYIFNLIKNTNHSVSWLNKIDIRPFKDLLMDSDSEKRNEKIQTLVIDFLKKNADLVLQTVRSIPGVGEKITSIERTFGLKLNNEFIQMLINLLSDTIENDEDEDDTKKTDLEKLHERILRDVGKKKYEKMLKKGQLRPLPPTSNQQSITAADSTTKGLDINKYVKLAKKKLGPIGKMIEDITKDPHFNTENINQLLSDDSIDFEKIIKEGQNVLKAINTVTKERSRPKTKEEIKKSLMEKFKSI